MGHPGARAMGEHETGACLFGPDQTRGDGGRADLDGELLRAYGCHRMTT